MTCITARRYMLTTSARCHPRGEEVIAHVESCAWCQEWVGKMKCAEPAEFRHDPDVVAARDAWAAIKQE